MCPETFNFLVIADFPARVNFVGVFFSGVLIISLFHQCPLKMRHVLVETASSISTTSTSGQSRILTV
jgi:hypothetical protein